MCYRLAWLVSFVPICPRAFAHYQQRTQGTVDEERNIPTLRQDRVHVTQPTIIPVVPGFDEPRKSYESRENKSIDYLSSNLYDGESSLPELQYPTTLSGERQPTEPAHIAEASSLAEVGAPEEELRRRDFGPVLYEPKTVEPADKLPIASSNFNPHY